MGDEVTTTETPVEPPVEAQETTPADNPEWNAIWEDVAKTDTMAPFQDKFKEALRPHLEKMDKRYQEISTKYSAWKELDELGATPDITKQALGLIQEIENDPVGFHKRLSDALQQQGLTKKEADAEATKVVEESESEDSEPENAKLTEIEKRQKEIEKEWADDKYNRELARAEKELNDTLAELKKQHLSESSPIKDIPFDEREVLLRVNAQVQSGKAPDFKSAYKEYADLIVAARSFPPPGSRTPTLTPSHGGNNLPLNTDSGIDGDKLNKMTKDQRIKATLEYMRQRESTS